MIHSILKIITLEIKVKSKEKYLCTPEDIFKYGNYDYSKRISILFFNVTNSTNCKIMTRNLELIMTLARKCESTNKNSNKLLDMMEHDINLTIN
jgi:hypothetical protein